MWIPYKQIREHEPDFRARYKFFSQEEGGRKNLPRQGYRSDFFYDGDNLKDGIYMIHPEFEDASGNIMLDDKIPVSSEGTARMWIIIPEMRKMVHINKISIGVRGYFMEGSRKVAVAEVIEILGLHSNAEILI